MADLTDWYPAPTQASPNGMGRPAAPATAAAARSGPAAIAGAPALWVLVIVGISFALLHNA